MSLYLTSRQSPRDQVASPESPSGAKDAGGGRPPVMDYSNIYNSNGVFGSSQKIRKSAKKEKRASADMIAVTVCNSRFLPLAPLEPAIKGHVHALSLVHWRLLVLLLVLLFLVLSPSPSPSPFLFPALQVVRLLLDQESSQIQPLSHFSL